jgi:microcystin-dependent protein
VSDAYLGEIRLMSFGFAPKGWALCNGDMRTISQNTALFALLGTTYGGNATSFALPDLRDRVPIHVSDKYPLGAVGGEAQHTLSFAELPSHTHKVRATDDASDQIAPAGNVLAAEKANANVYGAWDSSSAVSLHAATIGNTGGTNPHPNMQPSMALNFCIAVQGMSSSEVAGSLEPYIGEIRLFTGYRSAPAGWMFCDGQQLPITGNDALYSLITTTYGGDGVATFALPDLRSRVPVGIGPTHSQVGLKTGDETVTLDISQMPTHTHRFQALTTSGSLPGPLGNLPGSTAGTLQLYAEDTPTGALAAGSITSIGGSQPHTNLQPYLAVKFIIATTGLFPTQN